jgi:hypothetical protein
LSGSTSAKWVQANVSVKTNAAVKHLQLLDGLAAAHTTPAQSGKWALRSW